tara:strand:- start:1059 stop:1538 length:480 start_codon:yes stop_codon:yes gene_type:complete
MKKTYIVPVDDIPRIPDDVMKFFDLSFILTMEIFFMVFTSAQTWDDAYGMFESWLYDAENDGIDSEDDGMDKLVTVLEHYGEFNDVMGRTFHWLRTLPKNWMVDQMTVSQHTSDAIYLTIEMSEGNEDEFFHPDARDVTFNLQSSRVPTLPTPIYGGLI